MEEQRDYNDLTDFEHPVQDISLSNSDNETNEVQVTLDKIIPLPKGAPSMKDLNFKSNRGSRKGNQKTFSRLEKKHTIVSGKISLINVESVDAPRENYATRRQKQLNLSKRNFPPLGGELKEKNRKETTSKIDKKLIPEEKINEIKMESIKNEKVNTPIIPPVQEDIISKNENVIKEEEVIKDQLPKDDRFITICTQTETIEDRKSLVREFYSFDNIEKTVVFEILVEKFLTDHQLPEVRTILNDTKSQIKDIKDIASMRKPRKVVIRNWLTSSSEDESDDIFNKSAKIEKDTKQLILPKWGRSSEDLLQNKESSLNGLGLVNTDKKEKDRVDMTKKLEIKSVVTKPKAPLKKKLATGPPSDSSSTSNVTVQEPVAGTSGQETTCDKKKEEKKPYEPTAIVPGEKKRIRPIGISVKKWKEIIDKSATEPNVEVFIEDSVKEVFRKYIAYRCHFYAQKYALFTEEINILTLDPADIWEQLNQGGIRRVWSLIAAWERQVQNSGNRSIMPTDWFK